MINVVIILQLLFLFTENITRKKKETKNIPRFYFIFTAVKTNTFKEFRNIQQNKRLFIEGINKLDYKPGILKSTATRLSGSSVPLLQLCIALPTDGYLSSRPH